MSLGNQKMKFARQMKFQIGSNISVSIDEHDAILVSDVPISQPGYSDHVRVHVRDHTRCNVTTRFHRPQVFLRLDFQCRETFLK